MVNKVKIISHSSYNFRNIENLRLNADPEMNIIFGENGQGKTNIIESIWLMTGFYSFRSRKNINLIKENSEEAVISTDFFSNGREQNAKMRIAQRKELELNGIKEASPRAMIGSFYAVVFSPSTLAAVKEGPSERRKLLDIALSFIKPNYALLMSRYLRVVEQRNIMLKKYADKGYEKDYLSAWDEELVNSGAKIIRYRLDYIEKFESLASEIYSGISSGKEKFSFRYDFSSVNISEDEIKDRLAAELEKTRDSDMKRLYTGAGPHTHDLILSLDGRDARTFASQGQQRSCALALKLAEASLIEKATGESPVTLLDDVMSELDEGRQKFILNYLDGRQVFITCCDPSTLLRKGKGKIFEIKNGEIVSEK